MKGNSVSVLDELRAVEQRILARLRELQPAIAEYEQLREAAERLGIAVTNGAAAAIPEAATTLRPQPKPPAAPKWARRSTLEPKAAGRRGAGSSKRAAAAKRPGGTRAIGTERRQQVLDLIGGQPGISVPEISSTLGVDPPPLYRVVRKLQADGLVSKDGKALHLR